MLDPLLTTINGKEIDLNRISESVIGAAIEVHTKLGPGMLESLYEKCLFYELEKRKIKAERQVPIDVVYDDILMEIGFRVDIVVEKCFVIEIKSVENILPVHKAQLSTYLKLMKLHAGLLLNFKRCFHEKRYQEGFGLTLFKLRFLRERLLCVS